MQIVNLTSAILIATMIATVTSEAAAITLPPNPVIIGNEDTIGGSASNQSDDGQKKSNSRTYSPNRPRGAVEPAPPKKYYTMPEVRWDPQTQSQCLNTRRYEAGPEFTGSEIAPDVYSHLFSTPLCPPSPASPAAPAVPSPETAAQMVWRDQMKLPKPEPYIAPGKGITGLAAFLEIRGPRTTTQSFNVFGYGLTITATVGSYDVDWGDGSWSRGLTSAGGPWPNGDVRHVYTDMGTYKVRVVEHWSGTWSMAGGGGGQVAGTLSTEGVIPAFPVDQLQAVRNR